MRSESYLPNPCLLAIIITISTHKGPQFVLHYPPDPDNHGYHAAPTSSAREAYRTGDDNDASSSTSQSEESYSTDSYLSDSDEVIADDDSDRDIPRNYDNAKSGLPENHGFRRESEASTFTGSFTSQASSSFNAKNSDMLRQHKRHKEKTRRAQQEKRKSTAHRLTRSETNTINPLHRKALAEAKLIEELERARQNEANRNKLDDEQNFLEGDFGTHPRRESVSQRAHRRSSMSDLRESAGAGSGNRRRSSHNNGQRPKKLGGSEKLRGSAIEEHPVREPKDKQKKSPKEGVAPPDIQAWSGGVPMEYNMSQTSGVLAGTASNGGGSSQGDSGSGRGKNGDANYGDNHSNAPGGSNSKPSHLSWETVLGFDANFLSELLVPSRFLCNTRFELTVDDMAFLGSPVHVLPDGKWRRHRKKNDTRLRSMHSTLQEHSTVSNLDASLATLTLGTEKNTGVDAHHEDDIDDYADDEYEPRQNMDNGHFDPDGDFFKDSDNNLSDTEVRPKSSAQEDKQQEYTDPRSDMRMFHVVFVMNPPVVEYMHHIEEMYYYILSQFANSLRYEQERSNFVWNEVTKILQVRDKASQEGYSATELWDEISEVSSLAVAVSQLYNAVSLSEIANLTINNRMRAFQIPIKTHFETLPEQTEQIFTGTYLSSPLSLEGRQDQASMVNLAVLLLEDPEAIIRDIRVGTDEPLAVLIRSLSPNVSINQLAVMNRVDPATILDLTSNLIYWRRARTICPISHRNIYIVSPLSPMGNLYHFATLFSAKFPALPSLPKILSMLSTDKPRPYHRMIPSRDHRQIYLEALAWLLRYGFVTQLRTYLWLKITRRIKILVKNEMQQEEDRREEELEHQRRAAAAAATGDDVSSRAPTDYASNTAHHVPSSPTKVVVQPADDELTFKKTELSPPSPVSVRSVLQTSFKPAAANAQQPVQSALLGVSNGHNTHLSTSSSTTQRHPDAKTSENSTSAAISVSRTSNLSSGLSNRLGTSLETPGFLTTGSGSLPTNHNMHHDSSSIVGSLNSKRGPGPMLSSSFNGLYNGAAAGTAATDRSIEDDNAVVLNEEWIEDSVLLNPGSATALQLKWIAKIMEGKPADILALFGKLFKYMDGEHAMESVLVEENITRQDLRRLTKAIEDYIIIVRHW